jgi:hypothetical protein
MRSIEVMVAPSDDEFAGGVCFRGIGYYYKNKINGGRL